MVGRGIVNVPSCSTYGCRSRGRSGEASGEPEFWIESLMATSLLRSSSFMDGESRGRWGAACWKEADVLQRGLCFYTQVRGCLGYGS